MSKLMIVLVVLLSLAVAGLFLAKHKNASLRTSLDRANNVASEQQATITMLKISFMLRSPGQTKTSWRRWHCVRNWKTPRSVKLSARKPSRDYSMKTKISAAGTALTCLMLCAGCTSARPAQTPVIVHNACPKVSLCPMPGSDPQTNGDLSADIRQLENALARCASQVKMIKHCQDENDAQTRQPAQGAD